MRVAVVGGHSSETYSKLFSKMGDVEVFFHDGKPKKHNKKTLEALIKDVDYIIIVQSACSHMSMWDVKEAAKKRSKLIYYSKGLGISSIVAIIEKNRRCRPAVSA